MINRPELIRLVTVFITLSLLCLIISPLVVGPDALIVAKLSVVVVEEASGSRSRQARQLRRHGVELVVDVLPLVKVGTVARLEFCSPLRVMLLRFLQQSLVLLRAANHHLGAVRVVGRLLAQRVDAIGRRDNDSAAAGDSEFLVRWDAAGGCGHSLLSFPPLQLKRFEEKMNEQITMTRRRKKTREMSLA